MTTPGKVDVLGASLSGFPVVNIGHNGNVAWTHTNSTSAHFTLVHLTLDPADTAHNFARLVKPLRVIICAHPTRSALMQIVDVKETIFEHVGVDNLGVYSLIIGAQVTDTLHVPSGMTPVAIAHSRRAVFSVEKGHPERVGEKWRAIWACTDIVKTYLCDYEHYKASAEIDILVGIR